MEEYQSLVFLDPQNTLRMDWDAVQGMDGLFLIDNQGEPTVSVVDYDAGETIKKIDMGETGNHHLWVLPGARYVWSSQRFESDQFWTIDLTTHEVVDKFPLSMGDKKVIAPLHVGFAYTRPLAVVGNILDKEHGYLTLLSTVTRRPIDIIEIGCHGARDAMFTFDDSKIFSTCQQDPRGVSIVDVESRKEIAMVPVPGGRAGAMTPDGRYFLAAGKGVVAVFDTGTTELVKTIEVPGGGGNITCLADSSKCYGGLRKAEAVAVLDMASLTLEKVIRNRPRRQPALPQPRQSAVRAVRQRGRQVGLRHRDRHRGGHRGEEHLHRTRAAQHRLRPRGDARGRLHEEGAGGDADRHLLGRSHGLGHHHHRPRRRHPEQRGALGSEPRGVEDGPGELRAHRAGRRPALSVPAAGRPRGPIRQRRSATMNIGGNPSRRRFLRYAMVGGVAVPMYAATVLGNDARANIQLPADPDALTDLERLHIPKVTLPPVVEDGAQAPIVVEMDHPMDDDHYIRSIQILNFDDPIVIKGKFYFTPANGEAYLGTQIRLNGGEGTVWVIAECNQHGRWATSRGVKVAAGGC